MKKGYIVWNESNYGSEFFGVYKTWDAALKQYRKVIRSRFGKCPRGDYGIILDWLADNDFEADGNSYKIEPFAENIGE